MSEKHAGGRPKKKIPSAPIGELTKLYYSIDEVAEILGVHRNSIRNRIKSGEIKAIKTGRLYRIPKSELEFNSMQN